MYKHKAKRYPLKENRPIRGLRPAMFSRLMQLPDDEKSAVLIMLSNMTPDNYAREQYVIGEMALTGASSPEAIQSLIEKGLVERYVVPEDQKLDPADISGFRLTEKFLKGEKRKTRG